MKVNLSVENSVPEFVTHPISASVSGRGWMGDKVVNNKYTIHKRCAKLYRYDILREDESDSEDDDREARPNCYNRIFTDSFDQMWAQEEDDASIASDVSDLTLEERAELTRIACLRQECEQLHGKDDLRTSSPSRTPTRGEMEDDIGLSPILNFQDEQGPTEGACGGSHSIPSLEDTRIMKRVRFEVEQQAVNENDDGIDHEDQGGVEDNAAYEVQYDVNEDQNEQEERNEAQQDQEVEAEGQLEAIVMEGHAQEAIRRPRNHVLVQKTNRDHGCPRIGDTVVVQYAGPVEEMHGRWRKARLTGHAGYKHVKFGSRWWNLEFLDDGETLGMYLIAGQLWGLLRDHDMQVDPCSTILIFPDGELVHVLDNLQN